MIEGRHSTDIPYQTEAIYLRLNGGVYVIAVQLIRYLNQRVQRGQLRFEFFRSVRSEILLGELSVVDIAAHAVINLHAAHIAVLIADQWKAERRVVLFVKVVGLSIELLSDVVGQEHRAGSHLEQHDVGQIQAGHDSRLNLHGILVLSDENVVHLDVGVVLVKVHGALFLVVSPYPDRDLTGKVGVGLCRSGYCHRDKQHDSQNEMIPMILFMVQSTSSNNLETALQF